MESAAAPAVARPVVAATPAIEEPVSGESPEAPAQSHAAPEDPGILASVALPATAANPLLVFAQSLPFEAAQAERHRLRETAAAIAVQASGSDRAGNLHVVARLHVWAPEGSLVELELLRGEEIIARQRRLRIDAMGSAFAWFGPYEAQAPADLFAAGSHPWLPAGEYRLRVLAVGRSAGNRTLGEIAFAYPDARTARDSSGGQAVVQAQLDRLGEYVVAADRAVTASLAGQAGDVLAAAEDWARRTDESETALRHARANAPVLSGWIDQVVQAIADRRVTLHRLVGQGGAVEPGAARTWKRSAPRFEKALNLSAGRNE